MTERLPAHLEVGGLVRSVQVAGGFATVLQKGEHDAGVILVVCCLHGRNQRLYERMPDVSGDRKWVSVKVEDTENTSEFLDYLDRRRHQDPDTWIVELDIPNAERFIGLSAQND